MVVEFRILGPVDVVAGGRPLVLGGRRERALLALLLLSLNRAVSSERLMDELWPESPEKDALHAVRVAVSRLRKALHDVGGAEVLVTQSPGYMIRAAPEALDLVRFEKLVARGRDEMARNEHRQASETLREALSQWRGPALADVADASFVRAENARLEEARLTALEARVEADLACGRHTELPAELAALTRSHPLREGLWGQRMLALYRSGRQAEALRSFQELRRILGEELGIEPSAPLVDLERAMLRQELGLAWKPVDPVPRRDVQEGRAGRSDGRPAGRRSGVVVPFAEDRAWEPLPEPSIPMPALLAQAGRIFVGREDELAHLAGRWKDVAVGARRLVLIGGEPGVGKTRLTAELACRLSGAERAQILAGRCDEDLGVPYQPFVEALRHYTAHAGAGRRLGRHAGELARLLPELGQLVPGLPEPLRSDPETERYRLFDAVAAWLAEVSGETPVLLVLDDLHWAAKPTLLLLRHVMRFPEALRLLVVATYRDSDVDRSHPLADLLADLPRLDAAERVPLTGLDIPAVLAFLEQAASHDLGAEGDDLARRVWQETEGNAFFVAELVRHLTEAAAFAQRDGRWVLTRPVEDLGIPEGVRDVVGRRLSRLSEATNRVLACASVVGLEFDPRLVGVAGGFGEDVVLDAVEAGVAARLVVEVPGPVPRSRFAHALVRATLYDELSAGRRVALHRRVAEAIEATHAGALDDHLPALAHHWSRAATPTADTARAVDYAIRAGDRALAQLAHDEAVAYYRQALDLLELGPKSPEGTTRTELLIALGEAQRRAGDPGHRDTLLTAGRLARERGDADALVRASLANTRRLLFSRFAAADRERIEMLEAALAAAGPGDVARRARLLGALALELLYADDGSRRWQLAEDALMAARRAGDPATLAYVLFQIAWATNTPATLAQRLEQSAELVAAASDIDDPVLRAEASLVRCRTVFEAGDVDEFDRHLAAAERGAGEVGEPTLRWLAGCFRAGRELLAGRLADAERAASGALDLGLATGQGDARLFSAATLAGIRGDQGRLDEVLDVWTGFHESGRWGRFPCGILAWIYAEVGRPADARRHLEGMASPDFGDLPTNNVWLHLACLAATAAAFLGDGRRAEALRHLLLPYADHMAGTILFWFGSVSHHLGLLDAALGDHDEAEAHFTAAESLHARIGAPTWLARTRLEWARMLLARAEPGDGERAHDLLRQALGTARDLGLVNIERGAAGLLSSQ